MVARAKTLFKGIFAQAEVIHALILRETRTRFGAHQLGYLWALLEPALFILSFYLIFALAGRGAPAGMDIFGFVATGIVPYFLFRNAAERVAEAINSNRGLLFYPQVLPLDLAIARGILEAVTYSAVFLVVVGAQALYRQELVVHDLLTLIGGFLLAALLGGAVGLLFLALGQLSNAADRARGVLMRPLFWISGIFFAANTLPERAREILLWNPVLHVIEIVRDGWFEGYTAHHANASYVLFWILLFAFAGLALERKVRRRIEVS